MPDYSLVPVDYQPDFDGYSLVRVDHDPFADDGLAQEAQIEQAQAQPQGSPQQSSATGAGQPGVPGPATDNSPRGSGGGANVGNAGIDPSNPTWAQGRSPESAAFGASANPAPTLSPANQADPPALIRQKIVEAAHKQIGSGDWHFDVAKGNSAPRQTNELVCL